MSSKFNLLSIVSFRMEDLISLHDLEAIDVSDCEVLLKSSTYAIDIIVDKDGASAIYFDTSSKSPDGYNIIMFLLNKRRDKLVLSRNKPETTGYSELVDSEIGSLAMHLRNAGHDILSGSKDWIRSYSWPSVKPNLEIAALIGKGQ